ncbi:uncharacterized protein FOMMEDRAFT_158873 [Fomitiporia mediterranea MF3/22]|uniref:uncharacterized protein n=1 Tax=Fomitiporia mediterranea (strain MF3/22) TaxID=694068 RepID=UPI000440968A|nr:uncharacterized protein FOMMEDRAFT_158873 [Fomitiporia mediterranea MF3/22]EJD01719.1 hypothetical protein FOMMEDRAFT_158873 [Fomitiporia mediterranea MF3/22]
MLFTRIVSFFVVSVTFGTMALAIPSPVTAEVAKRDNAQIEQVFTTLKSSTDSILPQIQSIASSGNATDDNVTPLVNQLVAALDTATSSLSGLSPSSRALIKRQSEDDIASLVAGIVSDIANGISGLQSAASITDLDTLLGGIDSSLNQVLLGLEILLAGVLHLVANLLVDVAGLLNQLAFGLTLGTLGLA